MDPAQQLRDIAAKLVADNKGILAADESDKTIQRRFETISLESTPENRQAYRQLLFTTAELEKYISGVIMFDETVRQNDSTGTSFVKLLTDKGIIPGIKVDKGIVDLANFPNEKITQGMDELWDRLKEYKDLGLQFTKWRAVFDANEGRPSHICIESNIDLLARFAAMSQSAGLVPIVEPEILMDGTHTLEETKEATKKVLKSLFNALFEYKLIIEGLLLKVNMIVPGSESTKLTTAEIVAATAEVISECVSVAVPGIVFLSGGLSPQDATINLNEVNKLGLKPWKISFSFGRALQEPVLASWQGKQENVGIAQQQLLKRAQLNSLATQGKYSQDMENGQQQ